MRRTCSQTWPGEATQPGRDHTPRLTRVRVAARFLVGVIALVLTSRDANAKYSFGFGRAEVLGALASISIVWAMTLMLVYEACWRLVFPVRHRPCGCALQTSAFPAHRGTWTSPRAPPPSPNGRCLSVQEVVDGRTMFVISLLGVGMNFVLMGVLGHDHGGHGHSHG